MKFLPLSDNILVKCAEPKGRTVSGLYIPASAEEKPGKGEVLAVGPGKRLRDGSMASMSIKPGDVVFFDEYSGHKVEINNEAYLVMQEDDVFGVSVL